jgi:hypothetical protein
MIYSRKFNQTDHGHGTEASQLVHAVSVSVIWNLLYFHWVELLTPFYSQQLLYISNPLQLDYILYSIIFYSQQLLYISNPL